MFKTNKKATAIQGPPYRAPESLSKVFSSVLLILSRFPGTLPTALFFSHLPLLFQNSIPRVCKSFPRKKKLEMYIRSQIAYYRKMDGNNPRSRPLPEESSWGSISALFLFKVIQHRPKESMASRFFIFLLIALELRIRSA